MSFKADDSGASASLSKLRVLLLFYQRQNDDVLLKYCTLIALPAVFTSSVGKESAVTVAVLSVLPIIIGESSLIVHPWRCISVKENKLFAAVVRPASYDLIDCRACLNVASVFPFFCRGHQVTEQGQGERASVPLERGVGEEQLISQQ